MKWKLSVGTKAMCLSFNMGVCVDRLTVGFVVQVYFSCVLLI